MKMPDLLVFLAAVLSLTARGQAPAGATSGTTPAPAISPAVPAPIQTVYVPRLPAANELTAAAAAQHLTIAKIEQTATQVTVVYEPADGATNTVVYQMLPPAENAPGVAPAASTPPVVVYSPAPPVVVYDEHAPFYWGPPVSLHLGFGYRFGGFHRGHW